MQLTLRILKIPIVCLLGFLPVKGQETAIPLSKSIYPVYELQEDFLEFRKILEEQHCCLYEYNSAHFFDSLFDDHYKLIDSPLRAEEFFGLLATITARIGCMHTATWMPGRFFNTGRDQLFPLKVKLIGPDLLVTGSYIDSTIIPVGSNLHEINGKPVHLILEDLRAITGADALNPYFIDAQLTHRFSMFYASLYGFPEKYKIKYTPPGGGLDEIIELPGANIEQVRSVVFSHFKSPPLQFTVHPYANFAILKIPTFIYYDKVDYFRSFMDSTFSVLHDLSIDKLVLDLRGNSGGDPFCSVILFSYLQKEPAPYFAQAYGKYEELAKPVPMPEFPFSGNLYTLIDGMCGSTNGHFCALLDYHNIGMFVGTPSGATYKCNAGKDTEFQLKNTGIILTIGRNTYKAAVENMDKYSPIWPDIPVRETCEDLIQGHDPFLEAVLEIITLKN